MDERVEPAQEPKILNRYRFTYKKLNYFSLASNFMLCLVQIAVKQMPCVILVLLAVK